MADYSAGFAEPILWGAIEGYTVDEIAAGLEISRAVVIEVIEGASGIQFPAAARAAVVHPDPFRAPVRRPAPVLLDVPARIDPHRTDAAYLAWAKARRGASQTLSAGGPP
jgi:hypothetical protein